MTWSDVAVASAFVLGIITGAGGTVRLTRWILDFLRDQNR